MSSGIRFRDDLTSNGTKVPIMVFFFGSRRPKIPIPERPRLVSVSKQQLETSLPSPPHHPTIHRCVWQQDTWQTIQAPSKSLQLCILHRFSTPPQTERIPSYLCTIQPSSRKWWALAEAPNLSQLFHMLQVHEHTSLVISLTRCLEDEQIPPKVRPRDLWWNHQWCLRFLAANECTEEN